MWRIVALGMVFIPSRFNDSMMVSKSDKKDRLDTFFLVVNRVTGGMVFVYYPYLQ